MRTSLTSLLPPCHDRTDTFSLQYFPKCFKGQVTLREIPSRARTSLYPALHQHRDKNTTVKELILPVWDFSLFYLSLSECNFAAQVYANPGLQGLKPFYLQIIHSTKFVFPHTLKVICLSLGILVCS